MTFLEKYLSAVSTLECPHSYHYFAALAMISCLPGRRVWSRRGQIITYPNLYVVLVGEQGSGKTVAMREARNIIRGIKEIKMAPKCASARSFMETVAAQQKEFTIDGVPHTHAPVACFFSELANFIALSPEAIIPFLIDAYDDDHFEYETHGKGSLYIRGPAIALLGCCTHQWITTKMRDDIISGGFTGRTLWILEKERGTLNPEPQLTEAMRKVQAGLREECREVMKLSGEFRWTDSAKKTYNEWYMEFYQNPESMEGYANRKKVQVEKVAMLLAMANRKELVFESEDFIEALRLLGIMEKNLGRVFEGIGRNQLNAIANDIIGFLEHSGNGGIPEGVLRRQVFRQANTKETQELIDHLINSNVIVRVKDGKKATLKIKTVEGEGDGI